MIAHWVMQRAKPLIDTSADTPAQVRSHLHCDTLGYVQAKAFKKTVAVALEQVNPKHLAAH